MKLSVTQIKANFERLLERVGKGQEIIVTRYGRPIARLIPPDSKPGKPQEK
jgi:prevent-host-death family protein